MSFDTLQSTLRWLPVILTAQSNGIDPVTNAAFDDLIVKYRKEGDTSASTKSMLVGDWDEMDSGVYKIRFSITELNTLGTFLYSVEQAAIHFCTDFVPYYGAVEVVTATIIQVDTQLDTIEGKIDTIDTVVDGIQTDVTTIDGKVDTIDTVVDGIQTDVTTIDGKVDTINTVVDGIQTDVTTIDGKVDTMQGDVTTIEGITTDTLAAVNAIEDQSEVGIGAYYDEDSNTLTASLVLHSNGGAVSSPQSSTVILYDEDGTQLASGASDSSDSQGVFKYELTATLTAGTVPYIQGSVVNASGEEFTTNVLAPIVG